ncbi:MAG: S41 family peptidase [Clostridiaceae bacterium]|nr:S41 family peptidase [Clostridiaceae bacterium]
MKSGRKIGVVIAITIIITAILTFFATTAFYTVLYNSNAVVDLYSGVKLAQALNLIDKHYYYGIDKKAFVDNTLKTMLNSMNDPYTTYMDTEEFSKFSQLISGTYAGIGAVVLWDDELKAVVIVKPFDGSPAQNAGLVKGDKVLKIDGEDFADIDLDRAVSKMKGEKGTHVLLTVLKADTGETMDIDVVRDNILVPSVDSELKGEVGYIALSMFDAHTADEFNNHLNSMLNQGAKSILLDLRDNGGGLVDSAISVSNLLLKKDDMIFYTENKEGKRVEYKSQGGQLDMPIAVLINENSASAAELLAGTLRDNTGAPLIGQKSYGKGVVQMTYPFADGSVVKLTVEKYYTPNGHDINNIGIAPDYEVDLLSDKDEQLQMALEVIKGLKTD